MIERVHEPIRVVVDFQGPKVLPLAFLRGGRRYTVKRVNLISESGAGPTKRLYFSVSDEGNAFTLMYNPFDLSWLLTEVYADG